MLQYSVALAPLKTSTKFELMLDILVKNISLFLFLVVVPVGRIFTILILVSEIFLTLCYV